MPRSAILAVFASSAVMLACATPTWQQGDTTNKPRKNVVVQFTDSSLHPVIAQITQGGNVAWTNYSTMYNGTVLFPDSIRDAFTCSELRPLFMKTDTGYQSLPIQGDNENIALPCPLKPGEYDYRLNLYQASRGNPAGLIDDPDSTMHGKIIVE